jgi:amidase
LPATVVPVGATGAGLPVGIQIVAPFLHDHTALRLAEILSELIGPIPAPAGF